MRLADFELAGQPAWIGGSANPSAERRARKLADQREGNALRPVCRRVIRNVSRCVSTFVHRMSIAASFVHRMSTASYEEAPYPQENLNPS